MSLVEIATVSKQFESLQQEMHDFKLKVSDERDKMQAQIDSIVQMI